jgi:SAM-dependent methyltransferase
MNESTEFSRIAATAATLGDDAVDRHRFLDKHVLVTGEGDFLQTANGRHCLLAALHLLPRICTNVAVALPEGDLLGEARAVAARISFRQQIAFVDPQSDVGPFDSILSVGTRGRADLPWTVFHNDGWLARVSSGGADLRGPVGQPNPISALAAASLGVADTFKRLLGLRPSRGSPFNDLSWSLSTYEVDANDLGPPLPDNLPVDLLLGGAGAIGNGVLFLLSRLPLRGRILVVDSQKFGPENLGTCILIGPEDLDTPKVVLAERLLAGDVVAKGFHEPLVSFIRRLGSEIPYPKTMAAEMAAARGAEVAGIDAAEAMLSIARSRVPTGDFCKGDLEDLPFADESFDVVTGFNSLQYAGNPVAALSEAGRVAKRRGFVVIMTFGDPEGMEAAALVTALAPLLPTPPPGSPGPFALSDEAALRRFATDAGLHPVDVLDVDSPWVYADEATALRGLKSTGNAIRAMEHVGEDAVTQAYANALAACRQPDGSVRARAWFRCLLARP